MCNGPDYTVEIRMRKVGERLETEGEVFYPGHKKWLGMSVQIGSEESQKVTIHGSGNFKSCFTFNQSLLYTDYLGVAGSQLNVSMDVGEEGMACTVGLRNEDYRTYSLCTRIEQLGSVLILETRTDFLQNAGVFILGIAVGSLVMYGICRIKKRRRRSSDTERNEFGMKHLEESVED